MCLEYPLRWPSSKIISHTINVVYIIILKAIVKQNYLSKLVPLYALKIIKGFLINLKRQNETPTASKYKNKLIYSSTAYKKKKQSIAYFYFHWNICEIIKSLSVSNGPNQKPQMPYTVVVLLLLLLLLFLYNIADVQPMWP